MRRVKKRSIIKINNNHQLHCSVIEAKNPQGTIVLLNGSAFNYKQWDKIIQNGFFANDCQYTIVRYDYGGTGLSTRDTDRWDLNVLADELNDLLAVLKIKRVHIYGISKGTMVAQLFAIKYPQKIASIAGYGWYFSSYSRIKLLKSKFEKRIESFRSLENIWGKPLRWKEFNQIWSKVYRLIVMGKAHNKFKAKDHIIDFILRLKLYPLMAPTPIKTIYDWFDYALNKMPELSSFFSQNIEILNSHKMLIQHATNDETLPFGMAQELHLACPKSELKEYGANYTHISVAFNAKQAKNIIRDYLDFLERDL